MSNITKVPTYNAITRHLSTEVKQGVSPEDASYFLGKTYLSIVQDAERGGKDPTRFDELIKEQTPGGINEQVSNFTTHLNFSGFSTHKLLGRSHWVT